MKTYEELMEEIEKDSNINPANLDGEILMVPKLIAKYLRYHHEYKRALSRGETLLKQLVLQRQKYYNGNGTSQEYRDEPFNDIVKNQSQMEAYLDADVKICDLREKIESTDILRSMCQEMLENLKYRSTHLATVQSIRQFNSGA